MLPAFLAFRAHSQGRWISPDPAGLGAVNPGSPQTWNRYAYVGNNPLALIDPLGLCDAFICVDVWARGALQAFPPKSEATRFNVRLFDTWRNGMAAGNQVLAKLNLTTLQASTLDLPVSPANRFDGWGNPFCIKKSEHQVLVVSDGAANQPAIDCHLMHLEINKYRAAPKGKIMILSDGRLGILLDRPPIGSVQ